MPWHISQELQLQSGPQNGKCGKSFLSVKSSYDDLTKFLISALLDLIGKCFLVAVVVGGRTSIIVMPRHLLMANDSCRRHNMRTCFEAEPKKTDCVVLRSLKATSLVCLVLLRNPGAEVVPSQLVTFHSFHGGCSGCPEPYYLQ